MMRRRFGNNDFTIKNIPITRVVFAFFLGVSVAILAYCFFSVFAEVFRVLQLGMRDRNGIIKFNGAEQYWFNFLGAGIGVLLGNSTVVLYCISKPQRVFGRHSTKQKRVVNDQIFLSFNFLYWFAKVSFFVGLMIAVFIDFEFIKIYYYAFLLLLIVLYLESWKALSQVVKKHRLRIQIIHFITLLVAVLVLSNYNPIDHNKITKILETINPTIQLPISEYKKDNIVVMSPLIKLTKIDNDYLVIDGADSSGISLQDFSDYLSTNEYRKKRAEFTVIYLMADNNIPMKIIKELEKILRVYGYFKITYVTKDSVAKRIERYSRNGISRIISIPDYIRSSDGKLISPPMPVFDEEKSVSISVAISDSYAVGDEKVLDETGLVKVFESKINRSTFFRYEYSKDVVYQQYINVLSAHKQAVFNLKEKEGLFLKLDHCHENYVNDDQFNSCYRRFREEENRLRYKYPILIKEQIRD